MTSINHYFNNYNANENNEMRLMEDLVTESINIMGHSCYYLPREAFDESDYIYGENKLTRFNRAYSMPFYLANVEGYEGDGDFFSKFGLEIRDTSNFIVARRTFERWVPSSSRIRPREGDLLFVPVMQKLFEIKFVEEELLFFSVGKRNPYMYELRAELFRMSNENISTGVDEVDELDDTVAYTVELDVTYNSGNSNFYMSEVVYQGSNVSNSTASAIVKEWQPITNKLYLMNIKGTISSGTTLKGDSSNAIFNVVSTDTIGSFSDNDVFDNRDLQTEADSIIITQSNPLGVP